MNKDILFEKVTQVTLGKFDHEAFEDITHKVHTMSAPYVQAIINACVSSMDPDEVYLEVGSYQGGSMISALMGNDAKAISVDNFAEFQTTNNEGLLHSHLVDAGVRNRVTTFSMGFEDYFSTQHNSDMKVGVHYYDGAHDFQAEHLGLETGFKFLRKGSLIVIDDYSYPEVIQAINRFISDHQKNLALVFVMSTVTDIHREWWNGIVVLEVV